MPAIKRVAHTQIFSQLNNTSFSHGETNDCSVKALAVVARIPYEDAKRTLAARGRKARKGAYTNDILAAVRDCGRTVERVDPKTIIAQYPPRYAAHHKTITTHHPRRFKDNWPKGTFLLFTRGHVSACVDGELHDWAVNAVKRVVAVYRVQ